MFPVFSRQGFGFSLVTGWMARTFISYMKGTSDGSWEKVEKPGQKAVFWGGLPSDGSISGGGLAGLDFEKIFEKYF